MFVMVKLKLPLTGKKAVAKGPATASAPAMSLGLAKIMSFVVYFIYGCGQGCAISSDFLDLVSVVRL